MSRIKELADRIFSKPSASLPDGQGLDALLPQTETRYLHKPCGEHVLTKRGEPWRGGDVLLVNDVTWHFDKPEFPWPHPASKCPKCGERVQMASTSDNGMIPADG